MVASLLDQKSATESQYKEFNNELIRKADDLRDMLGDKKFVRKTTNKTIQIEGLSGTFEPSQTLINELGATE